MTSVEQARVILDPRKLKLPQRPRIATIEVDEFVGTSTGTGTAGAEGLRVQVILSEDTTDDDITGESVIQINSAIHAALRAQGIEEFPYVFFAKRSELESLDEAQ